MRCVDDFQNIVVRSNGDLLLTEFAPTASLYLVSNPNTNPKQHLIHTFDSIQGLAGIAEPTEDLFVVVGGNITGVGNRASNNVSGNGSSLFFAWTIDLRDNTTFHGITDGQEETKQNINITQIAQFTSALLPNGVASIPGNPDAVLIADSLAGLVWRLDIQTGSQKVAVKVPEMSAPTNSSGGGLVGINGIKMHLGYLYWKNSATVKIYRVKLDRDGFNDGNGTAAVETVADLSSQATFVDDFAIDDDGVVWVVTNSDNTLLAVKEGKKAVLVGGGKTELTFAGDTAAAFGRDHRNRKTLYVTTCGGLRTPVNGTVTEGGKVVAVDTSGFRLR
ncbi:hypothetical protein B0T13DRAFT_508646 [Neurospora crassa]|nr:hypothetical protein B0T13DRAFT_508646 [Neurospora crassa]